MKIRHIKRFFIPTALNLKNYNYTKKWFIGSDLEMNLFKHFEQDQVNNILEIGSFEGLSGCWFSDYFLDNEKSTLFCVDPFLVTGKKETATTIVRTNTETLFRENIKKSKNYKKCSIYKMSSKQFFKQNNLFFNLIFIDGSHHPEDIYFDMKCSFDLLTNDGVMWMDDYKQNNDTKMAMNKFLEEKKGLYELLHKRYQLAIRKK